MLNFQTFDQWHSVAGFLAAALFFFIYPVANGHSLAFRVVFFFGVLLAICLPFFVEVTPEEQEKMLFRSGKMVDTISFILLFYCYHNRAILQQNTPYFFWFCYALGAYNLFDLLLVNVLFSGDYQFVNTFYPWLNTNFGITDFNFPASINYLTKFIFLGLFFRDALVSKQLKQIFQYIVWILVVFELVQVFVFKSYQGYDSISSTVKNIFLIGGSGLLLYRIYGYPNVSLPLSKNPYFWICLGLLLPALAELFLELIFTKLYKTDIEKFYKLYLPRNASQLISFAFLIVGVWQAKYLKFLPKAY